MSSLAPLLGHEHTYARLTTAAREGHLHHALLFQGPPGVGKRTAARRLAMAANCERTEASPCGECGSCQRVQAGTHPDVIEIEPDPTRATPTITVTQIREMLRTTRLQRYTANRRFILIDPADAMNPSAANALLKTLEEPPDGTGFILITAQASNLLPTIRSRCQQTRFGAVGHDALRQWLHDQDIADAERIARHAQGSPGRAMHLAQGGLEERLALRGELIDAIQGDLKTIFAWSQKLTGGEKSAWRDRVDTALDLLDELLRDTVVVGAASDQPLLHDDQRELVTSWSSALWPHGASSCSAAVEAARDQLAASVSGKTVLDALITRLATELGAARRPRPNG